MPPKQRPKKAIDQLSDMMESVEVSSSDVSQDNQLFEAECECGFVCRGKTEFGFNRSWDAHQFKCPRLPTHRRGGAFQDEEEEDVQFDNYIELDGFSTKIPPNEIDISMQRAWVCKYGCVTPTGLPKRFASKARFLEHIVEHHPKIRIVLESPPDRNGNGNRTIAISTLKASSFVDLYLTN